jgi:hypothetical protein
LSDGHAEAAKRFVSFPRRCIWQRLLPRRGKWLQGWHYEEWRAPSASRRRHFRKESHLKVEQKNSLSQLILTGLAIEQIQASA